LAFYFPQHGSAALTTCSWPARSTRLWRIAPPRSLPGSVANYATMQLGKTLAARPCRGAGQDVVYGARALSDSGIKHPNIGRFSSNLEEQFIDSFGEVRV